MGTKISPQNTQGNISTNKVIIRAPRISKHYYDIVNNRQWYKVAYYNGEEPVQTYFNNMICVDIAQSFQDLALKDKSKNKGTIMQKDALAMLQDIFLKYGRQFGKTITQIKALFDLYMTEGDGCDGGVNITQKEQFDIMKTLDNWFGHNYYEVFS